MFTRTTPRQAAASVRQEIDTHSSGDKLPGRAEKVMIAVQTSPTWSIKVQANAGGPTSLLTPSSIPSCKSHPLKHPLQTGNVGLALVGAAIGTECAELTSGLKGDSMRHLGFSDLRGEDCTKKTKGGFGKWGQWEGKTRWMLGYKLGHKGMLAGLSGLRDKEIVLFVIACRCPCSRASCITFLYPQCPVYLVQLLANSDDLLLQTASHVAAIEYLQQTDTVKGFT